MFEVLKNFAAFIFIADAFFVIYLMLFFIINNWSRLAISKWVTRLLGWLSIFAICIVCFSLTIAKANAQTLCLRLNNPMCITAMPASNPWQGQIGKTKEGLARFDEVSNGLRAGAITLLTYKRKHKINTLTALLRRFCQKNREIYEKHLNRVLRLSHGSKIDIEKYLPELMEGIITFENGKSPWSATEIKSILENMEKKKNGKI